MTRCRFTAPMWQWRAVNGVIWHLITMDADTAAALSAQALMQRLETGRRRGFGALRVRVRIGTSDWQTSAFRTRETGWMIPVKAEVRRAEALVPDALVDVELEF